MPYKSEAQRRFFKACKHGASMRKKCPSKSAISKFESHGKKKR